VFKGSLGPGRAEGGAAVNVSSGEKEKKIARPLPSQGKKIKKENRKGPRGSAEVYLFR